MFRQLTDISLSPPDHDSASMRSGTTPLLETSKLAFVPSLSTPGRLSRDQNIAKPRKHLQGWRMGITLCAATAGTVLIVNLSLTIWASVKFDLQDGGLGTVQEGSCQKTRDLSLWLHLAINVLSTLLLSASNYCMQCLSAPTREEVDRAHHRGKWLDIGVPSLRNLTGISWYRLVLWWLLALSGIPLHLLYNSAVFSTLSSVEYQAFVGTSELVSGVSIDWSTDLGANSAIPSNGTLGYFEHVSSWTNLTNYECILAYGKTFVSKNRDVLAVTSQWNTSASLLSSSMPVVMIADATSQGVIAYEEQARPPYVWICGDPISGTCDISEALINADGWTLSDDLAQLLAVQHPISYCLSQSIKERCRLRFSVIIMSIVIGCNLTKTICMLLILRRQRSQPLTTLGDAIESFLLRPDSTTEQMRLRCRDMERRRWFHGASLRRWLTCNVL